MPELASIRLRVERIFEENLNLVVPSVDTDLFETGGLDSLSFVELLVELEREYNIKIALADLEFERFRSIATIVEFVAAQLQARGAAADLDRRAELG